MTMNALLALGSAVAFVAFGLIIALRGKGPNPASWIWPAVLAIAFLGYSLLPVIHEGPFGFWSVHTESLWGSQVWMDLLLAIGIGWAMAVPQAKALGMNPLPWLVLIVCTGSIGLLAMIARILYLRAAPDPASGVLAARGSH